MTRALKFTKGHGTGNDFVLISDPAGELDLTPTDYAYLADRHVGVGGDGVIRAVRTANFPEWAHLLESDPDAEWFMDYRNGDFSKSPTLIYDPATHELVEMVMPFMTAPFVSSCVMLP